LSASWEGQAGGNSTDNPLVVGLYARTTGLGNTDTASLANRKAYIVAYYA
jgi:hypothetical protein